MSNLFIQHIYCISLSNATPEEASIAHNWDKYCHKYITPTFSGVGVGIYGPTQYINVSEHYGRKVERYTFNR